MALLHRSIVRCQARNVVELGNHAILNELVPRLQMLNVGHELLCLAVDVVEQLAVERMLEGGATDGHTQYVEPSVGARVDRDGAPVVENEGEVEVARWS